MMSMGTTPSSQSSGSQSVSTEHGFVVMSPSDPDHDDMELERKQSESESESVGEQLQVHTQSGSTVPVTPTDLHVLETLSEDEHEDEDDSEYESDCSEYSSSMPLEMLFGLSEQCDEDILFAQNGYKRVDKICDTLQGELYKAEIFKETRANERIGRGKLVAIKKIDKSLKKENIAQKDDMMHCVDEDVEKEAKILRHLTFDNTPTGKDVARFVEFFESDTHLYLVTEFVDGCTLDQFVRKAFELMDAKRLSPELYRKCVKFIMWQMVTTISWLQSDFHCCHMDLCLENVMVHNVHWTELSDGRVTMNPNPKVKVVDFGVAEIFETPRNPGNGRFKFECDKEGLNIDHEARQAPESENGAYDARALDMWSIGMIFYEIMVGHPLYEPMDKFMWNDEDKSNNGYWAVKNGKLREFMARNKYLKLFKRDAFDLLEGLLNVHVHKRINAKKAERHVWFRSYYKRNFYVSQQGRKCNIWNNENRATFPYYSM